MKNIKQKLSKGFSLTEMLVVIAVIGIIAVFAIPSIKNSKQYKNHAVEPKTDQVQHQTPPEILTTHAKDFVVAWNHGVQSGAIPAEKYGSLEQKLEAVVNHKDQCLTTLSLRQAIEAGIFTPKIASGLVIGSATNHLLDLLPQPKPDKV